MSRVDHIRGQTYHARRGAVDHAFRYTVDYVLLDAEDAAPQKPALFSRNRGNLAALHDVDHGGTPGEGRGVAWVREVLAAHHLGAVDGRVDLLAQPRVLGHQFNPVSFWLCHGQNGRLRAVIAEVNNTFGDRHSYLCHHPDQRPITPSDTLAAQKIFHVSPFQKLAGTYRFRFDIGEERVGVWIDYSDGAEGGVYATLTGRRRALGNREILMSLVRRPLGSRRVLALIHWHALRLFLKGASYRRRPEPPGRDLS
ncbi:hypothetical protein C8N32_103209 [Rhodovulum imhoffii]|uniref:Cyclopropane-fatty-acyl-phospholipid synthase n=1 Tax=Rhodovulum imhoffii TaxID=365340 RepID=A0A2T5BV28_9RHOB|nr:DUF1365 domain-containing protein [Rhodovulum imhoffii]MBK5934659.1 cyclopropane-fatty-acyl-phospholipid synthase [Rhodovulum imhoffii]PTN03366.1 hypothetical protein C8N32_103209 [Rhodovulum imhoffii]